MVGVLPKDIPEVQAYVERLGQRPAYQAVWARSNELASQLES